MEQSVKRITEWLQSRVGGSVAIRKEEDGDRDDVRLQLKDVVFAVRNETHPDDYVAEHALILKGTGMVRNGESEVPLPENLYEIPYNEKISCQGDGSGMKITTDRASYFITTD